MSNPELEPRPSEAHLLHGHPIEYWYTWLTTNTATGESHAHLATPVSRYGKTTGDVAWWAVAAEYAYTTVCGDESDGEAGLHYMMSLSVNDSHEIADLIHDTWRDLPKTLRDRFGTLDDVKELRNGGGS
jgi:hypothetical protein